MNGAQLAKGQGHIDQHQSDERAPQQIQPEFAGAASAGEADCSIEYCPLVY
jgi:hypothetical protein